MREKLKRKYEEQLAISESIILSFFLAIVGGYLDAYTYISRGKVFANAQTGNIVLLGIHIFNGEILSVLHYFLPIVAFSIGIIVSEYLKNLEHNNFHWRQIVIGIEFLIVAIVGFLNPGPLNYIANVLISFACALQVQAFRRIYGTPFATTMCTGNLRTGTEFFCQYIRTHDRKKFNKCLQYLFVILSFTFGACLGTCFTAIWNTKSIFFCNILLGIVFVLLFEEKKYSDNQEN